MIIAHPGAKSKHPINSQLIMENNHMQYVHNILISMPGAQLTVASTCTYHCGSKDHKQYVVGGKHYGVSEFYVEKDSELCFSMVGVRRRIHRRSTPGATPTWRCRAAAPSWRTTASSTATTCVWSQ